jgi:hypothetical protein
MRAFRLSVLMPVRLLRLGGVAMRSSSPVSYLRSSIAGCFTLIALAFTSGSFAEDAVCKLVLDAMERGTAAPNHVYMVRKIDGLNGGRPESSETINTGKFIYVKHNDKWQKSSFSSQQMQDQLSENRRNSKATCRLVRDEAVDGVSAGLYTVHEESEDSGVVDSKIWLAKSDALPVHVVLDMQGLHSDSRYVYDAVAPDEKTLTNLRR